MAGISLQIGGDTSVHPYKSESGECLLIDLKYDLPGDPPIPFSRENIYLHGSESEIRSFATKILAALPETDYQRAVRESQESGGANIGKAQLLPCDFYDPLPTDGNRDTLVPPKPIVAAMDCAPDWNNAKESKYSIEEQRLMAPRRTGG